MIILSASLGEKVCKNIEILKTISKNPCPFDIFQEYKLVKESKYILNVEAYLALAKSNIENIEPCNALKLQ